MVLRLSDEETYWIAPLPTPTVTTPSTAGEREPNFWRKSTARALESASFWLFTSSRSATWAALRPRREAWLESQPRAAVAASPEAAPRVPLSGEMEDGVP